MYQKNTEEKRKSEGELVGVIRRERGLGKTIVTINGSFDIVHAGHVAHLEEAAQQGDILIVGVNSDASVKTYKSPLRPIIPGEYRARLIAAFECVDYVFLFDDLDPRRWLKILRPDVHCNSAEYGADCVERPVLDEVGARLHLMKRIEGISTSEILRKVLYVAEEEKKRKSK